MLWYHHDFQNTMDIYNKDLIFDCNPLRVGSKSFTDDIVLLVLL